MELCGIALVSFSLLFVFLSFLLLYTLNPTPFTVFVFMVELYGLAVVIFSLLFEFHNLSFPLMFVFPTLSGCSSMPQSLESLKLSKIGEIISGDPRNTKLTIQNHIKITKKYQIDNTPVIIYYGNL